ncbi:hypothetical protein B0H12DRAFT_1132179 [Mycena haematopus]|nr:hypothetical protein B0H12DRAFT_1132179 [Mycena haematopus]
MDAHSRGMFLASAGFLFASIGFTLSVLSTFLRWVLPYHPTPGAAVASTIRRRSTIRRLTKHRRSHVPTPNSSSISSSASTSTSLESTVSEVNEPRPDAFRADTLDRLLSVPTSGDRPDFRNTAVRRHRRSDSAPPSPAPWASSHLDGVDTSKRTAMDDTATALNRDGRLAPERRHSSIFHLPRKSSLECPPSLEDEHAAKNKDYHSCTEEKYARLTAEPLPLVDKRRSQLFAPLLHRRQSQIIDDMDEQDNAGEAIRKDRRRIWRGWSETVPNTSHSPYEAPYFFPAPGSVDADNYLPPRRKPVRSKTLVPDEIPQSRREPTSLDAGSLNGNSPR